MTTLRSLAIALLAAITPLSAAQARHYRHHGYYRIAAPEGTVIVGTRPAGCPHAFCGCEASLFLFHKIVPELNLALNWLRKFPRAEPAPMRAAARPGHVFILMRQIAGDMWLVHDGNSGGHLTREHVRSIRGYRIVDPRI